MDAHPLEPSPCASLMDWEHREVLESLSGFRSAVDRGRPADELTAQLADFLATIEKHFASEEELMRSSGYSAARAHAAEHQRLLGQLRRVKADFASGAINPGGALGLFVEVWTVEHIERHDNPFAAYLNGGSGLS